MSKSHKSLLLPTVTMNIIQNLLLDYKFSYDCKSEEVFPPENWFIEQLFFLYSTNGNLTMSVEGMIIFSYVNLI